ncbi:MAG: hypothetical protein HUK40_11560 [Desulfobacter sp.]|nr:hypothetical protein [Desulfobacter sp.]WDP87920.1 MAG: hypothetical protein HUN05_04300 [Desulfobacter sp.]
MKFIEYDLQKQPSAAKRMRSLGGGRGVPFALINGQKIRGFSKTAYQNALGI